MKIFLFYYRIIVKAKFYGLLIFDVLVFVAFFFPQEQPFTKTI